MDQNTFGIRTSYPERNKHNVQANRESKYMYNNLPSTSSFSQSSHEGSRVQSKILKDLQLKVSSLNVTCEKFNDTLHQFSAELDQIKMKNDSMAGEIAMLKDSVFDINYSLSYQLHDRFNTATEVHEQYQRSKNLLVFNIPDSMDETPEMLNAIIIELLTDMGYNNEFPEVTRFGHYRGKDRPILLVFKLPDYAQMILKHKTILGFFKRWHNVKIGKDLTHNQRLQIKFQNTQFMGTVTNNQNKQDG